MLAVKGGVGYRHGTSPLDAPAFLRALAAAWAPAGVSGKQYEHGEICVNLYQVAFVAAKIEKRLTDPFRASNIGESDATKLAECHKKIYAECEEFGWFRITKPKVFPRNCMVARHDLKEEVMDADDENYDGV
jgi:hypothetical protein